MVQFNLERFLIDAINIMNSSISAIKINAYKHPGGAKCHGMDSVNWSAQLTQIRLFFVRKYL